jgi:hypothetical protein
MGSCEHGNKHAGPIKDVEILDQLSYYQVLKRLCCRGSVKYSQLTSILGNQNI